MNSDGKKRILVVSDSFPPVPSGVSKYAFSLTKELIKLGYSVDVLTGGVGKQVEEDEEIKKMGGNVLRVGKLVSVKANGTRCYITIPTPGVFRKVQEIIKGKRYDALILQGPLGLTLPYPATVLSKAPKIGVFHSTTDKPNLGYILFGAVMKPFLKALNRKIAVSRWAKWEIEKYFGPQEMEIIPPGVDTRSFSPKKGKKIENKLHLLFVGRLDERKGTDILVEVWEKTKKVGVKNGKKTPAELLIAGDGPMKKKIMAKKPSATRFLGFVEEKKLPEVYASADFTVFPAKGGESFGIVLIESMASGTPPLASNIKGYSDVVKHGENGLLFPDKNEMKKQIELMLYDEKLRTTLGRKGREEVKKKYSWEKIAQRIKSVIDEVCSR